jgi:hypothetical protein
MPLTKGCTLILTAALLCAPLIAQTSKGKSKSKGNGGQSTLADAAISADIQIILGEHRRIVREYVRERPADSLPPGLAKRGGSLPPGLEKQLSRNGVLPPGLRKKLSPYPAELSRRLPPLGDDYEGGFLHGRVVIFNKRTSVLVDVFVP